MFEIVRGIVVSVPCNLPIAVEGVEAVVAVLPVLDQPVPVRWNMLAQVFFQVLS